MAGTTQDILATASQSSAASDPASASPGASGRKQSGGVLKADHAPWDTVPAHTIDLVNGRSAYGGMALEEFWEYVSSPTKILQFRTECPVYSACLLCV